MGGADDAIGLQGGIMITRVIETLVNCRDTTVVEYGTGLVPQMLHVSNSKPNHEVKIVKRRLEEGILSFAFRANDGEVYLVIDENSPRPPLAPQIPD